MRAGGDTPVEGWDNSPEGWDIPRVDRTSPERVGRSVGKHLIPPQSWDKSPYQHEAPLRRCEAPSQPDVAPPHPAVAPPHPAVSPHPAVAPPSSSEPPLSTIPARIPDRATRTWHHPDVAPPASSCCTPPQRLCPALTAPPASIPRPPELSPPPPQKRWPRAVPARGPPGSATPASLATPRPSRLVLPLLRSSGDGSVSQCPG